MSDLIKRDELLQALTDFEVPEDPDGSVYIAWGIGTAMRLTKNIPAVDAVEVVRCKDCKRRVQYFDSNMYVCTLWQCNVCGKAPFVKDDGFCSFGKRREENAVD